MPTPRPGPDPDPNRNPNPNPHPNQASLIKELELRDLNEAWRSPHLEPLLRKLKASLGGPPAPQ